MSLLIDIILAGILICCFVHGYKRGFVRSLTGFVGYLLAAMLSSALSNMLSVSLYRSILRGPMVDSVTEFLETNAAAATAEQAQLFLDQLPAPAANLLANEGITADTIAGQLTGTAADAAPQIVDLLSPVVINLSRIVLMVVLFSVFMMVVRIVVRTVAAVFRLPLLRQINGLLGAAFGLLSGVIVVMLLCAVMQLAAPLLGQAGTTQQAVQESRIYQLVYENNPVYSMFRDD